MSINSYKEMNQKKAELEEILLDLAGIIDELGEMDLALDGKVLLELKDKLDKDNFKVLVIGEFKNGKSTFINSLMGEKVLPAYSTPCTAVISEVKYGESVQAILYFKSPLPKEISEDISDGAKRHINKYKNAGEIPAIELTFDELEDYLTIQDPAKDQADSIKETPYSKVELRYPIELCRHGVELIDSPGLNENGTRTKVTEEYLRQADAIVFVFRCPKIAGKSEMEYIQEQIHTRGYRDIFFVCNAINQVDEEERERLVRFGKKKLAPMTSFGEKGVFFVDALGALKTKQGKGKGALEKTSIPQFEQALSEYLNKNRGRTKLLQVIGPCRTYVGELRRQHIVSYAVSLSKDIEQIDRSIENAMPELENAKKKKETISRKIDLALNALKVDVQKRMDEQYGVILSKIPKVVEKMELENHMTVNPFRQKEKQEALEKEVLSNLERFVEKEMGIWVGTGLKDTLDGAINSLQKEIEVDIETFYENLDKFQYQVSGIEKTKEISGMERVLATVLGTAAMGPAFGALGATMGFGEVMKRSALTFGAGMLGTVLLAFTPLGVGTIVTTVTYAMAGGAIAQLVTGGNALTNKYKKQLQKRFVEYVKEHREEDVKNYADGVTKKLREQFSVISQALDSEIKVEESKIATLRKDRDTNESKRKEKVEALKEIDKKLAAIENALQKVETELN